MTNADRWLPSKFEFRHGASAAAGVLRGARDARALRVPGLRQAAAVRCRCRPAVCGLLRRLGPSDHIDLPCDLSPPRPFEDQRFDTLILADPLGHIPDPGACWRERTHVLAPGGRILRNVPSDCSVPAHLHDEHRYTNFALERLVAPNGLRLPPFEAVGGLVDLLADLPADLFADLFAKAFSKVPALEPPLAVLTPWMAFGFHRTGLGARVAGGSSRHLPLGYFLIAEKPGRPAAADPLAGAAAR